MDGRKQYKLVGQGKDTSRQLTIFSTMTLDGGQLVATTNVVEIFPCFLPENEHMKINENYLDCKKETP